MFVSTLAAALLIAPGVVKDWNGTFSKHRATLADYAHDKAECQDVGWAVVDDFMKRSGMSGGTGGLLVYIIFGTAYDDCLKGRGWTIRYATQY
jgi:hypothetical protein